jgi:hypothetical protein
MRRLTRGLFTLCSAISLLWFVTTAAYWVRAAVGSDYFSDRFPLRWIGSEKTFLSCLTPEGLHIQHSSGWPTDSQRWHRDWFILQGRYDVQDAVLGFRRMSGVGTTVLWDMPKPGEIQGNGSRSVTVKLNDVVLPYWFMVFAGSILPFAWFYQRSRARLVAARQRSAHCHSCGYDLRESPERCPECGRAIQ